MRDLQACQIEENRLIELHFEGFMMELNDR
jgi:hypothetical protein